MAFALKFDTLARKVKADPNAHHDLQKLCTAMPGTPDYEAWMNTYLNDQGGKMEICLEDDNYTATWYIRVPRTPSNTHETENA